MSFNFKTSNDINAVKYEGVRLLPSTPRNPNDFHSIQDILRHRMAMLLDELYGNCRVAIGHGDPFALSVTKVKANGVWYLNGYRIELNDLESTIPFIDGQSFNIWLDITFETIDLKEDSSIALQDAGTDKFIPTSERFRFAYALRTELLTQAESLPTDVDATYHIGVGTVGEPITFEDAPTIAVIDLKYATAIEIAQNAVSVDADGWAYIEKMATGKAEAAAFVESDEDNNFLKMGIKAADGEIVALIQALNLGRWFPTFTLKRDDQTVTISPDGAVIDEGTGNAIRMSPDSLSLASSASQQFSVSEYGLKYNFPMAGNHGFEAVMLAEDITEIPNAVIEVAGDYAPPSGFHHKAKHIRSQPNGGEIGTPIYRTSYAKDFYPKDGIININHLIKVAQGQATAGTVKLDIKFFDSITSIEPSPDQYDIIKTYTWDISEAALVGPIKLKFHPHPGEVVTGGGGGGNNQLPPVENPIGQGEEDPWYAHFRFEYTIISEQSISGTAEWLSGANLTHNAYINPFILTGVDYLRIQNYFLFVDGDGALRIKAMSTVHDGSVISAISQPPGSVPTDPGGMIVGGGVKTISSPTNPTISLQNDVKFEIDITGGHVPMTVGDTGLNGIRFLFPEIDQNPFAQHGLVTRAGWDGIMTAIIQGGAGIQSLNSKTDNNQLLGVTKVAGAQGLPIWTYNAGSFRHDLQFPNPNIGGEGLFSNDHYVALQSAIHNQPENVKYVAESWNHPVTGDPLSASDPFFTNIQNAIDAADSGDTVMVHPGVYNESIILKDLVNVIAYDIPNTFLIGTVYDRDLNDSGHNVNGVKCEVAITIETLPVSANISALIIDRAGSDITTRGTFTSKAIGSSSDASQPKPTVDVRAGRWVHHGDIGRRIDQFTCMGGGVDVHGTNGIVTAEIYGNIWISQHLNYGSFLDNLVCGIDVGTKGGNSAKALMVGDIYSYQGCFALLKCGGYGAFLDHRGNLYLYSGPGICVDINGPTRLADGKYTMNGNTESPISLNVNTNVRLRSIELHAHTSCVYGISANGDGSNKYVVALPVYSNKPIDPLLTTLLKGDYNYDIQF